MINKDLLSDVACVLLALERGDVTVSDSFRTRLVNICQAVLESSSSQEEAAKFLEENAEDLYYEDFLKLYGEGNDEEAFCSAGCCSEELPPDSAHEQDGSLDLPGQAGLVVQYGEGSSDGVCGE